MRSCFASPASGDEDLPPRASRRGTGQAKGRLQIAGAKVYRKTEGPAPLRDDGGELC